ncbi:hypothetical protein L596_010487 [Steinernema carpocapsae]|uniref:Secreted protein n=1 Tax=Steinernema carpocapsae TaxID=34508 RepID=A0A4U5PIF9_STECR|nr:hypothetical protein L596_010487 [Steinernema carpocapsae]
MTFVVVLLICGFIRLDLGHSVMKQIHAAMILVAFCAAHQHALRTGSGRVGFSVQVFEIQLGKLRFGLFARYRRLRCLAATQNRLSPLSLAPALPNQNSSLWWLRRHANQLSVALLPCLAASPPTHAIGGFATSQFA